MEVDNKISVALTVKKSKEELGRNKLVTHRGLIGTERDMPETIFEGCARPSSGCKCKFSRKPICPATCIYLLQKYVVQKRVVMKEFQKSFNFNDVWGKDGGGLRGSRWEIISNHS